mmetsp:Transcript_1178/g.3790  ORF Transcript_1178/g.3790 Transcript_1178/m.3790 type:complete len:224 (-) Transcript_1178:99-770(-)
MFGMGKPPAERIKEYNRQIKKSVREIDRERTALERQEKKLLVDIKKAAKDGQMDSAKIMAKDLVRTRGYIKKMFKMKAHMEAVSLRLQTMSSSAQMAQCMKGVTKVMGKMNAKMSSASIQKIMMEFEKQNEMMGMKEEMMGDAMDDAFADEEDSEEEDSILGSVLAEIGVELDNKMMGASTAPMQAAASTAAAEPQGVAAVGGGGDDDLDAELQKRLDNLRRT